MRTAAAVLLFALAGAAAAGQRGDYAQEWPLRLAREDGGAFRVVLSEAIYRAAHDPALADIEVFNAAGESLPATLLGPEGASAQEWPRQTLDVPWFLLPPAAAPDTADWNLRAERDAAGRVLRIDASMNGDAAAAAAPRELLLDLSQIRAPLAALRLDWADDAAAFQTAVTLSASDDLQHWQRIGDGLLADLRNGAERLRRDRIELGSARAFRYLRIAANTAPLPPLRAVRAEAAPPPPEPEWRWLSVTGEAVREGEQTYYRYRLPARIPVRQLDVRAEAGNSLATWTVASREQDKGQWITRAGPWTGYRVASGDSVESSTPQQLSAPVRDRDWRISATPEPNVPPSLVLGYRPEVLVFLAQGEGPYTIAAGSASARRRDAPVATLLDALRQRHGADWKPYPAVPETGRPLAGDAAHVAKPPPPKPQDWRGIALWIVLVGGSLLIVAMALSLLRKRPGP